MNDSGTANKRFSTLLVCYGDHPHYSCRALESLLRTDRLEQWCDVHVGCNACCQQTVALARQGRDRGQISTVIESGCNMHKDPMLRQLLDLTQTGYVLMMDDDSYVKDGWAQALTQFITQHEPLDVAGHLYYWPRSARYQKAVEQRPWWRGMQYVPEAQREQFLFATGGLLLARTAFLRQHDFPDRAMRIEFDDAMLADLVYQVGGRLISFDERVFSHVVINDGKRRWVAEDVPRAGQTARQAQGVRRVTVDEAVQIAARHLHRREFADAEAACNKILAGAPRHPRTLHILGLVAYLTGRPMRAWDLFRAAIAVNPADANVHNDLGNVLVQTGHTEEATTAFRRALELKPDHAQAHNNLANTMVRQGNLDQAVPLYRKAIEAKPDYTDAYTNMARTLRRLGRRDESTECYRKAAESDPSNLNVQVMLAMQCQAEGRVNEAIHYLDRAVDLLPSHPRHRLNRALLLLMAGRFEAGWNEYEWRLRTRRNGQPEHPQPQWDGSNLTSRTILLHCEQGLGATLQFIRYALLVADRGGKVIVQCQPPLKQLLRLSLPADIEVFARNEPLPSFDVHLALMSLPRLLGTRPDTIPAPTPYLKADAGLVVQWRAELASRSGFRVGIAWQGNPQYGGDRTRSIPLKHYAPLAQVAGIQLFGLQKNEGAEQVQEHGEGLRLIDLGPRLDETTGPFMDTAAVMMNLELVITSDTSIAHLAGALGVPVWVALCFMPDWRWMLEREDCPWYPNNMRLFRQKHTGDWGEVFGRIAEALRMEAAGRQR